MGFRPHNVPKFTHEHVQKPAADSVWQRSSGTLVRLGSWTAALLTRYEAVCVAAAALGYALAESARAARPLWFDEIFTFQIARLPDVESIFRAIPADGNPPLYYLLTRLSFHLLGETAFAARLPSILAFTAALLATYCFVCRRSGPVFGMFAMLALSCTYMSTNYGAEARPYALLAGFTGLTMVSWQAATEQKRHRMIPLIGMALGIAGAIVSHHYGVLHVGIPLICGESVRLLKRRQFDVALYAAGIAGLSALFVTFPLAVATHHLMLGYIKSSASFFAKPSTGNLSSYTSFLCVWILLIFLALLYLTYSAAFTLSDDSVQSVNENGGPAAHEVAGALGLALLFPFMIAFTWTATGYFMDRYAISAALGIAILIGFAGLRLGRNSRQATAVAALCAILLGGRLAVAGASQINALREAQAAPLKLEDDSFLSTLPGNDPIVMASAMAYGEDWFYAPQPLRERLHYLADLTFAVHQSDFLSELSLDSDQAYILPKVDEYRQFLAAHNRFYVYKVGIPQQEWTPNRLASEGWTLKVVSMNGDAALYLAQAPER
jgi:hypothetical protein